MTVAVRGLAEVHRYLRDLPGELTKVLKGAGRAGGSVIADEARLQTRSDDVRKAIVARTKVDADQVRVTVTVKPGWARSVANWLEYGTSPHFISVDDSQRMGMSVKRVNAKTKDGSLVIGGQFVGSTVHHPGARPHPFLRPALDTKRGDAIAAAASYITSRIDRGGVNAGPDVEDEE